jgi:putative CRISPR-associated protein (TIGR02619 family)
MKKVITMVGTSLFENYLEMYSNDTNFKNAYNYFKNNKSKANDLDKELNRKGNIEGSLRRNYFKNNQNASAEIKSLIKLKEKLDEELEIYLLYSDTALSRLVAERLYKVFYEYKPYDELKDCEVKEPVKIKGLQVWDRREFNKGLDNLISEIDKISNGYYDNIIINITGGYKVTIPYLTIFAQVNKCPIYYIFEDTEELIEITPTPIDINWGLFEKYSHLLNKFSEGVYDMKNLRKEYSEYDSFYNEFKSLLWIDNDLGELNPLGNIFWNKYKDIILVYIAKTSEYFERLTDKDKKKIENSIRELYLRLTNFIGKVNSKKEAIDKIISLNENDLRHAKVIDRDNGVFIFKSTNEEHIRLLYSFEIDNDGNISSIRIYDFVYQKFEHNEYIDEFKNNYPALKDKETTIIPIKKEDQHV